MKLGSITVYLYLRASSTKKGSYSITCKLSHGNQVKVISTGIQVPKKKWNAKSYTIDSSLEFESILLQAWKNKLNKKLLHIYSSNESIDIDAIALYMKPRKKVESPSIKGYLEIFSLFIEKSTVLIGKEYTKATVMKFHAIHKAFSEYLLHTYQLKDIPIEQLRLKHLLEYEEYAILHLKHQLPTVHKSVQRLKQVIKYAVGHDYIIKDPWLLHKSKSPQHEIIYLNKDQLQTLIEYYPDSQKMQNVRDCFLFCCFTGLAYAELSALDASCISSKKGITWIQMRRKKTSKSFLIPMLPPAQEIWVKYNGKLPVYSNQKYNQYLKELANTLQLEVHLTTHIARKTFTTTVLLGNNIPLKVASALLGHADTKITEKYYAEITNDVVDQHVETLMGLYKK